MKFKVKTTKLNGNSDSRLAHGASGIMIPIAIETNEQGDLQHGSKRKKGRKLSSERMSR